MPYHTMPKLNAGLTHCTALPLALPPRPHPFHCSMAPKCGLQSTEEHAARHVFSTNVLPSRPLRNRESGVKQVGTSPCTRQVKPSTKGVASGRIPAFHSPNTSRVLLCESCHLVLMPLSQHNITYYRILVQRVVLYCIMVCHIMMYYIVIYYCTLYYKCIHTHTHMYHFSIVQSRMAQVWGAHHRAVVLQLRVAGCPVVEAGRLISSCV